MFTVTDQTTTQTHPDLTIFVFSFPFFTCPDCEVFNFFVSVLCSNSCALVRYNSTNSAVIRSGGGILQLLEAIPALETIRFVCISLVVRIFKVPVYHMEIAACMQLNGTSDLIDHTTYVGIAQTKNIAKSISYTPL